MSEPVLGSDELYEIACDAEDMGKEVAVYRSEIDDEVILYVEVDGEEYWNDLYDVELDDTDRREAGRYYYG